MAKSAEEQMDRWKTSQFKKKGRILVLDQDVCTCDFLGSILKLIGAEYELAKSVEQAMEVLEKNVFDLLITDLHLPNCQDFLQANLQKHPRMQTIIMYQQRHIVVEALRLQGATFIQKPFNFDDIVQKIHQAIQHGNLQQVEHQIKRLRQDIFRI